VNNRNSLTVGQRGAQYGCRLNFTFSDQRVLDCGVHSF
jgi:hypothetical protein